MKLIVAEIRKEIQVMEGNAERETVRSEIH